MSTRVVRDLLKGKDQQLFTVAPDTTVQAALEIMASKRVSSLPVMVGSELVGIFSERDYIRRAVPRRIAPWDVLVKELDGRDEVVLTSGTAE
jgi:CBS domain-containing protein